jgi:transcription elongation GreA/GreB family factor
MSGRATRFRIGRFPPSPISSPLRGWLTFRKMVDLAQEQHTAARDAGDANEVARTERDLRYWTARQATAQVMKRNASSEVVEFGSSVTIRRQDGRNQTFRIVGTDEADPARGTLSYIAPLAKALLGRSKGDNIRVGEGDAKIAKIE